MPDLALDLDRAAQQEQRALEIVQVEQRLGLQVVDLGLDRLLERGLQQVVGQVQGLFVLLELLDHDLDPVQLAGLVVGLGLERPLELLERLLVAAAVPEQLAAAVVGLGAFGVGLQGLVQPGQGLVRLSVGGGFHGLVQTIPVAISIEHVLAPWTARDSSKPRTSRRCATTIVDGIS